MRTEDTTKFYRAKYLSVKSERVMHNRGYRVCECASKIINSHIGEALCKRGERESKRDIANKQKGEFKQALSLYDVDLYISINDLDTQRMTMVRELQYYSSDTLRVSVRERTFKVGSAIFRY